MSSQIMGAAVTQVVAVRGGTGALPSLILVQGPEQREITLSHTPFTVGRLTDNDLVIADPRVTRKHAELISEGGDFYVVDLGSKHGTFVNGEKVTKQRLSRNDRVQFGERVPAYIIFNPSTQQSSEAREFLSQIGALEVRSGASDLEKLTLFLEAARKLSTTGALDEILVTLIEAALRLTGAERGYVYLKDPNGELRLAAGRHAKGEPLADDKTISHSILQEAVESDSEFLLTDTTKLSTIAARESIVAYDLRTVICIPLRRRQVQQEKAVKAPASKVSNVRGVLYLDSRFASGAMSTVSNDIIRAIATEAAALVENADLVQIEQAARKYQQELAIAASIQQRLMAVTIPDVPFAQLHARSLSCREIGGDFFDVVVTENGLSLVVTDVCGKGISAAILASILQGMIYSQLVAKVPLPDLVTAVNRFLCQKDLSSKYATLVIAHLKPGGEVEFVNCGHVPPLLVSNGKVTRTEATNVPVGLLPEAVYVSNHAHLGSGDRLVLVTDGVTEAENAAGDFFSDERLEQAANSASPYDEIMSAIRSFCGETPLNDDCTVVELTYKG
jgi:phosphoserine phosphatase RsbU/P